MQPQQVPNNRAAGAGWQAYLLPLLIMAVGTALAFVSTALGGLVILVGYVWLVVRSLPGALAVYVVFAPFQLGLSVHHHRVDVSDMMALVMAIRLLLTSVKEGSAGLWDRFMGSPFWRPLSLLLILSILSLATALSHSTTLIKILEYIEFFVVIVAVARDGNLKETAWKPVVAGLFVVADALSLYGFYQFLLQVGPASHIVDGHHMRADAVFGQPNAFGGFEAMVFPVVLALLAYGPSWARRWWTWVTVVLVAVSVIDSYSRGAWVASVAAVFFMGVVAWAARGRTQINRRFVVPGIIVPILAFVFIDLLGKTNLSNSVFVASHTTGNRISSTVTALVNPKGHFDTLQRLKIWKEAIRAMKTHPILGVGLGGFHRYAELHPEKGLEVAPMAHNLYLEWGADLGIVGFLTGLWIEFSWVKSAVAGVVSKVRALTPFEFAMGLGAFGTIVSFIVHDWVDFMIDHGVVVPLLLALAVVWSLADRKKSGDMQ